MVDSPTKPKDQAVTGVFKAEEIKPKGADVSGVIKPEETTENNTDLRPADTSSAPTVSCRNSPPATKFEKHRVIILADQRGKGVQDQLQKLLGPKYDVFCFFKSGATISDVLSSCKSDLNKFTMNDYVILLGFMNDTNPFQIRHIFTSWLNSLKNTNVITCETPYNQHLNERKLNNEIKFVCHNFKNCVFLDLDYSRFIPSRKYHTTYVCRNIIREILRLCYHTTFKQYELHSKKNTACRDMYSQTETKVFCNQTTQTENDSPILSESSKVDDDDSSNANSEKEFFREQGV